jgi:hypothetical protein
LYLFTLLSTMATAQTLLDRMIYVDFENVNLEEVLDHINKSEGIVFAYSSDILPQVEVSISGKGITLHQVLEELFYDREIKFLVYAGQVILQKAPPRPRKFSLNGMILDRETNLPISFSTIEKKGTGRGSVADHQGRFSLELKREEIGDTLVFSSMGYERMEMIVGSLAENGFHRIFLRPKTFELHPIEVKPEKFKTVKMGNQGNMVRGSMYIDTHGQQTALFIENDMRVKGKIIQVQYFLSRKGNSEAPFRVRLYLPNASGKPGKDLLPQMVVVKPEQKSGWYTIDISEFEIDVPENGFFVAMEGVFPNDYEYYVHNSGFVELSDIENDFESDDETDFEFGSVTYGQRLAYCRKRQNNTWHYSLSRTWFQVQKRHYGAMMGAVIELKKDKRTKNEPVIPY